MLEWEEVIWILTQRMACTCDVNVSRGTSRCHQQPNCRCSHVHVVTLVVKTTNWCPHPHVTLTWGGYTGPRTSSTCHMSCVGEHVVVLVLAACAWRTRLGLESVSEKGGCPGVKARICNQRRMPRWQIKKWRERVVDGRRGAERHRESSKGKF